MGTRVAPAVLVVLAYASISGVPSYAQSVVTVGDRVVCPDCRIATMEIARLGADSDPAGFGPTAQVAMTGSREFIVSTPTAIGELLIYGADGRYVRSAGRRGSGPGEFNGPAFVAVGPGDSIHTLEMGQSRYSVFGPDLRFARAMTLLARAGGFAVGPGGRLVVAAVTQRGGQVLGAMVLGPEGEPELAFAPIDPAEGGPGSRRLVAFDPEGRPWTLPAGRYEVTSWGEGGQPTRAYRATRPWLSGEPLPGRLDLARDRPPAQMSGLQVDREGRVWVFAAVAAEQWRPADEIRGVDRTRIFDTIVEVFDSTDGRLLAQTRLEGLVFATQQGVIYTTEAVESGDLRIVVSRIWLEGA